MPILALILLVLDLNNILSVPWWIYVLSVVAFAIEIDFRSSRCDHRS